MKGGREDVVFLPSAIVPPLREFVSGLAPGPLFRGQAGAPLTPRHVHRRLRTCAEKAGVARSISPHRLITLPRPELWPDGINEMESFEFSVTDMGNVRTGSPSEMHDDCVIGLALAAWPLQMRQAITWGTTIGMT